jgi:hypothetical protein
MADIERRRDEVSPLPEKMPPLPEAESPLQLSYWQAKMLAVAITAVILLSCVLFLNIVVFAR